MARPKKDSSETEAEDIKGNIAGLTELKAEFKTGKMPERKLVALRQKLVSLFTEEKITEDEQELMEAILIRERARNTIVSRDSYLLNKIESDRIEEKCIVKTDDAPSVHHLYKDLECKYIHEPDFNDNKNRKDSIGRFHVYVPRKIPTRHQLSIATVEKEDKGHPVPESEYPAPKTVIHRLTLKTFEFEKWFEPEDESLLSPTKQKLEQYTF